MEGLTVGRMAHYIAVEPDGEQRHVAAIVTAVVEEDEGEVWLTIFPPDGLPTAVSASYDASGARPWSWHFIERA